MELKSRAARIIFYIVCCLIGVIFFFPLYYSFINTLRGFFSLPVAFWPREFNWSNWKYVVTLVPFLKLLGNSLIILAISIPIGIITNFSYGYALSRLKAPGNQFIFTLVLCSMMIPAFATQIPQYILLSKLGITNTFWIWVFEGIAGTPFVVFLCRQYLSSIPLSLMEAATIDGCNEWQKITKMAIPMAKPLVALVAFKIFNINWDDYMTPYMYLSREKWPLIMALFNTSMYVLPGTTTRPVPVVQAAALTLSIPTIIVFFLCQKQLQQSEIGSGVKG